MLEQKVVSDAKIMVGKPIISGTRITVESILEKLSNDETHDMLLQEFPTLTKSGILAALKFATEVVSYK